MSVGGAYPQSHLTKNQNVCSALRVKSFSRIRTITSEPTNRTYDLTSVFIGIVPTNLTH